MKRTRPLGAILRSILLLVLALPMACSSGDSEPAAETSTPTTSESQIESQIPTGRFVGNVVETMDAGTYTYVELERAGERIWAAGPQTSIALGDEIVVPLDMPMHEFESDTLGRRFETLYFVAALAGPQTAAGSGSAKDPHAGLARSGPGAEVSKVDSDPVEKADGGYTVAELWDRRQELAGKDVVVRGRVVKYNGGILGRNWLHIQDGSGDAATGRHDLTVTSEGSSAVGDVVTVRGVVALDRDFGAGYSYELIVENATVAIE
jgi:hypothetical protein